MNICSEIFLTIIAFSFIANLAKSIGSRGSKALSRQEIKQIAPSFLWLLRDAILEPVNSRTTLSFSRLFVGKGNNYY